jgi:hypothetical protein
MLIISKSPLGDLGVSLRGRVFEIASYLNNAIFVARILIEQVVNMFNFKVKNP